MLKGLRIAAVIFVVLVVAVIAVSLLLASDSEVVATLTGTMVDSNVVETRDTVETPPAPGVLPVIFKLLIVFITIGIFAKVGNSVFTSYAKKPKASAQK